MRLLLRLSFLPERLTARSATCCFILLMLAALNKVLCISAVAHILVEHTVALFIVGSCLPIGVFCFLVSYVFIRKPVLRKLIGEFDEGETNIFRCQLEKTSRRACLTGFLKNWIWQILLWSTIAPHWDGVEETRRKLLIAVFVSDLFLGRAIEHMCSFHHLFVHETSTIMFHHVEHFRQDVDDLLYKHYEHQENQEMLCAKQCAKELWLDLHGLEAKLRFYMELVNSKVGIAFAVLLLSACYITVGSVAWFIYLTIHRKAEASTWFGAVGLWMLFSLFRHAKLLAWPADAFHQAVLDLDTPLTIQRLHSILGAGADSYILHLRRMEYGIALLGRIVTTPYVLGCLVAVVLTLSAAILEGSL